MCIKNMHILVTNMFKFYRTIYLPIVRQLKTNAKILRQFSQFDLTIVKRVFCETESISFLGTNIRHIVPNEYKKETSLNVFK